MQAERELLIKRVFPELRSICAKRFVTFTEVDLPEVRSELRLLVSAARDIFVRRHDLPPRLQIVAQQENPNGFPSHPQNQFAFDGLLCHQAHRPTGTPFRRTTAYHCNQTLFLVLVEHFRRPWPVPFIQCSLQPALLITTANIAYGLGSERDKVGNLRSTGTFRQLQQSQCP